MKRLWIVAVVAAFALAGAANAGQTIRVLCSHHSYSESIQKLIPAFEKETGIKVNYEVYGDEQVSQKLTVEFAAKSGTLDVFKIRPLQDMRIFYRNGWCEDLRPYFKDDADYDFNDFSEHARNLTSIDGYQCVIPVSAESEVLFYRKDLFAAKGLKVPDNFEEFEAAAKTLTDRDKEMYGFVSRGARSALITMFSSFLYGFGGDWVDKNGNSGVDTPEFIAAAEFYSKLLRLYGPPGGPNISWPQSVAIFGQGKAAMYTDDSTTFPNILDPTKSAVADKTGVALFPAGPKGRHISYIVSQGLGISKFSQNKDAAWKFIRFMSDKPRSTIVQGQWQNTTARVSVYNDPAGIKNFQPDFAKAIGESIKYAVDHDRPQVTAVQEARDIIGESVVAAIEGKDFRAAAKVSSQRFQELLDREKAEKGKK